MSNKIFSNDEISALAYEAKQLENAGYQNEAAAIRCQPLSMTRIVEMITTFIASLFSRDLPAALAYESSQMQAAGYVNEYDLVQRQPGITEHIIALTSASLSSLFHTLFTRDMPAALAYEASQMVAAGYQPEKVEDSARPGILEQLTSFIANYMEKPQPAQSKTSLRPTQATNRY